jgi:hypothetical protein
MWETFTGCRALLSALIAVFVLAVGTSPLTAQTAPPPVQPGDLVWAFAQEPPLNDVRVATAFGLMFEERVVQAQATAAGRPLRMFAADPRVRSSLAQRPVRTDQIPQLLAAAGFPPGNLIQAGPCKYWAAPAGGTAASMPAEHAAGLLVEAMRQGLLDIGSRIEPCQPTGNAAEAHLLVWVEGQPAPQIPVRRQPTFLTSPELVSAAAQQGRSGPVALPHAGDGSADRRYPQVTSVAAFVVMALALVVGLWVHLRPGKRQRGT